MCIGSIRDMREGEGEVLNQVGQVLSAPELPSSVLSLSLSLSPTTDPRRYVEPPSMLEFHPMQGRSLPDPLAWERDPGTWTQPTRRTESASSTHKVISAFTASFSIGVITSTIDLLSGNAQVRGGVGGTYRSLMREDLCEV